MTMCHLSMLEMEEAVHCKSQLVHDLLDRLHLRFCLCGCGSTLSPFQFHVCEQMTESV